MQQRHHNLNWQRLPGHRNLKGRAGHTSTLVGRKIFVLGGRNGNDFFNDMWIFNTETEQWKQLQQHAPFSPRAYHTATLVKEHELWLIGGSDQSTMYGDVHVLNTNSFKWSSPMLRGRIGGKRRGTHAAVLHPSEQHSILVHGGYGGVDSHWLNDLVVLHTDILEWEELEPVGMLPLARGYHTMVAVGTSIILYGGKGEAGIIKTDTLSVYDVVQNKWITPKVRGEIPSPRSNHAAALLEDHQVVIHGGRHGSSRLSDTCVLQVPSTFPSITSESFIWHLCSQGKSSPYKATSRRGTSATKLDGPGGRAAHSLVVRDRSVYVFGGYGGQGLTFVDMYVIREFPHVQGLRESVQVRHSRKSSTRGLERFLEDTDESEETLEGWRNTKKPRKELQDMSMTLLKQDVPITVSADDIDQAIHQENIQNVLPSAAKRIPDHGKGRSGVALDVEVVGNQKRPITSGIEERTYEMLAHEKELLKKELAAVQQTVEALKTSLKEKFEAETLKVHMLEKEADSLKENLQASKLALEFKEHENADVLRKMKNAELKLDEIARLLEETKDLCTEAVSERDDYKSCVQRLEVELEKQMQTLQQANTKYESERKILFQEIAERKSTTDRLFTELGIHKESMRSMQETIERQSKESEQVYLKLEKLQREKEELTRSNGSISAECRQLVAAREGADAKLKLANAELQSVRASIGRNDAEFERLKESAEQAREHITSLHASLKKNEEDLKARFEENERLKSLIREVEDFEQTQVRLLQGHVDKLRCARQQCPG
ncbi:hypothetical protein O6H91_02G068800 [Diphasiastrum complanatum]|uniref:Uncharacterized protein n=1 Tax=Diphasiastrum complanatum TaxID=34168 RepID=A0ACC2EGZ6_DIPCM|nr:hypothetical protein O6H91_02G068800 [Diphasiastrum complanatum]